ncbi:MAG: putative lipid II flippase FtsW [Coriobacteriia bacterium]|nr:putative lipid II flippase FtsW [Coriobacteriia bacterium]
MARRARAMSVPTYLLLGSTIVLLLCGLLMIYSASSVSAYVKEGNSYFYLIKQLRYVALGLLVFFVASRWNFRTKGILNAELVAWAIWGVSLIGLLLVPFIGIEAGGAKRWLLIGSVSLQPSEYAKLGCLLVTAVLLAAYRKRTIDGKQFLSRLLCTLGPVAVLVMLQPDMGTTVSILIASFLLLWLGGIDWRVLGGTLVGGGALAVLMVALESYRMDRVAGFLDPWADPLGKGYQIIQASYAFGSGGLTGVGLGLSRQKFAYLPAAHTDFIFAIIGEEAGLLGTVGVIAVFAAFTYAGIRIALECRDPFGRLMAGGLTVMIATQAVMNMAAVTGLMPVTGIPLPLVSYGGSSLTFTMGCIGLILAVSRRAKVASRVKAGNVSESKGHVRASTDERRRDRRSHLSGIDGGRTASRRRA